MLGIPATAGQHTDRGGGEWLEGSASAEGWPQTRPCDKGCPSDLFRRRTFGALQLLGALWALSPSFHSGLLMAPYASFFPIGSVPNPAARQPDQLTIEFRPAEELVAVRWVGTCTTQRVREVYHAVAAMLIRTEAHRVLFDTREREVIGEEASRWIATEAYVMLLNERKHPLRVAYAVPAVVYQAFVSNGRLETAGELLQISVFDNPGTAVAWLRHHSAQ
jgi:hypothetical protein